jgi:3-methyl-2-oxobutanoate hydroxymethyltransferase
MMMRTRKCSIRDIGKKKRDGKKQVWLTAYDYFTARYLDASGVDGLLVGDSLNMVFYGREDTLSLTLEQSLYHTEAVARAARRAVVIGDMPFLTYQQSISEAIANAGRYLKETGAQGVKLEGGIEMAATVKRLVEVGIPVMGHIGLTPQSIHRFGGYRVQGRDDVSREYLMDSAHTLQDSGAFAIVLEAMKPDVAEEITKFLSIPTIGIGAGKNVDGQIMVINDIMGLDETFDAKFVRKYFDLAGKIREVGEKFVADVLSGDYPSKDETY